MVDYREVGKTVKDESNPTFIQLKSSDISIEAMMRKLELNLEVNVISKDSKNKLWHSSEVEMH